MDAVHDVEKGTTGAVLITSVSKNLERSSGEGPVHAGIDDEVVFHYPDGGAEAWLQVVVGTIVQAMSWGYASCFGIYQLYYTETLGLPNAQIAWIGSVQTFLAFLMCAFSGRLADAGYAREIVIAGSFLSVFGSFMTSLATEYW
jgi:MCP family monocarboxylic acid transporter-like MFS transporter 3